MRSCRRAAPSVAGIEIPPADDGRAWPYWPNPARAFAGRIIVRPVVCVEAVGTARGHSAAAREGWNHQRPVASIRRSSPVVTWSIVTHCSEARRHIDRGPRGGVVPLDPPSSGVSSTVLLPAHALASRFSSRLDWKRMYCAKQRRSEQGSRRSAT